MRSSFRSNLFRQIFLGVAILPSFSSHALTSKTSNVIHGNAPYLTFDGGRTRVVDTNGLLGITLSDGTQYTPLNNTSSTTPIVLPDEEQSFADIDMFVPTDTDSVALSSLIGPPNNYWGDDDGDNDVTVTGSLSLSIVDNNNQAVSRNSVLTICNSPYRVTLSSTNGTLSTRYGVPNSSDFSANVVTYFVNPKATSMVCFTRPNLKNAKLGDDILFPYHDYAGPSFMWDPANGFIPQSTDPSRYGSNFPTTGANGLYFDLDIKGVSQPLSWSSLSQGGITVTMSNSTAASVRVTLTGPFATEFQHNSDNPGLISKPILPQTFELVGRDGQGNPVIKYGFTLKQWFVNRGTKWDDYSPALSWCNSIGYRMPLIKDLTNATCRGKHSGDWCEGFVGATPSSPGNYFQRRIGSGFFNEWGPLSDFGVGFTHDSWYWTSDVNGSSLRHVVQTFHGGVDRRTDSPHASLCSYP